MSPDTATGALEKDILLTEEPMELYLGPVHPAMHGTVRIIAKVDGEVLKDTDVEVGFLHRGFEKMCEESTWVQCLPYTDRLNYVSPLINNVGYMLAVEKLMGIQDPPRSQYIRVIVSEISRITDHLTCVGAGAMELGGFTAFLYFIKAREELWHLIEMTTGARLTTSYTRVGGVNHDLRPEFFKALKETLSLLRTTMTEVNTMLTRNRIFMDRMCGTGVIDKEKAVDLGFTGPCLRATGVDYDVRKDQPYLVYDELDFDVPIAEQGDNYDRYLVRMEEIRQSIRLIEQCIKRIPDGPVVADDPRVKMPDKQYVYTNIESLMNHFKHIMEGVRVPPGETYTCVEGGNGELGFYIVSDGGGKPYKLHIRPPCFALMQGLKDMLLGGYLADVVPTFGSINMIGGEIDR